MAIHFTMRHYTARGFEFNAVSIAVPDHKLPNASAAQAVDGALTTSGHQGAAVRKLSCSA
jgi:hypothetical protein